MPVSDVTWEYINVLMLVMDEPNSFYPYDDLNDNAEPLKEWADKGYLDRSRPYPLSVAENRMAVGITGTEQALMLQNMYLTLQAMGLGGWLFSASAGQPIFELMGFRFYEMERFSRLRPLNPDAGPGLLPVGLDSLFQAYVPPYYPDMSAAVQAIWDVKWGKRGIYKQDGAPSPLKDRGVLDKIVQRTPQWCLEATKALCEYVWETYGRFPAFSEPMQMNIWFQAHHLETDFYDRYYQPGAYHPAVREHMAAWHSSA